MLGTAPLGTAPLGSTRAVAAGAAPASYSATGAGGVTIGGAAPCSVGHTASGSGGVVVGGAAPFVIGHVAAGLGGVVVGGSALCAVGHVAAGAGGVTIGGAAPIRRGWARTSVGGVVVAGAGAPARGRARVGSGGVTVGGAAIAAGGAQHYARTGSGGVAVGGAAARVVGQVRAGSGGVRVGGSAIVVAALSPPLATRTIERTRSYTGPGWVGDRSTVVPAQGVILVRGGQGGVVALRPAGAVGMPKKPKQHHGGGQVLVDSWMRHGDGGVRVGGHAMAEFYQGSGGPIISPSEYRVYGSGGVAVAGVAGVAASFARRYARAGSGGVQAGGAASSSSVTRRSYARIGGGLILVRGASPFSRYVAPAPGGGTLTGAFVTPTPPAIFDTTRDPAKFAGPTLTATSMADLQAKINASSPGTVIGIPLGANWQGNLVLPDRGFGPNEWVEIRPAITPAALDAIRAYGRRMNPGALLANNLPVLRSPGGNVSVVSCASAASGFRFSGIGLYAGGLCNGIVRLGKPDMTSASQACSRLIVDRCVVLGGTTYPVQRGIYACGEQVAVLGCWVADCYGTSDSQAILVGGWQGPYMVLWNRCEGWSENFATGGIEVPAAWPSDIRGVPSDVTFHYNYCTKNLAYKGAAPFGNTEKNLCESKSVRRASVKYNIFEYMWPDGQDAAINLKSTNQTGTQRLQGTQDYEFAWNWVRQASGAIKFAADPGNTSDVDMNRVYAHDNLFENINTIAGFNGGGLLLGFYDALRDVTFEHNTYVKALGAGASIALSGAAAGPIAVRSNILHVEGYGLKGSGASGSVSWQNYIPNPGDRIWDRNLIVGSAYPVSQYPATTLATANDSGVGYADLAAGDYTVTGANATAGHDGGPLGVSDMAAFRANLANVLNG